MLGQRLLPLLDVHPDVGRIVGLDVRDPARRVGKLTMHRVDVAASELKHVLEGVDVVVHLASLRDPMPDADLMQRVNVEGTRRLLDAAAAMGVTRVVRVSSAAVYGAWPDNPVPLTEDAPLRPSPGFLPALHDAECERLLAVWEADTPGATTVVLRVAPIVGPGEMSLLARCAIGRTPVQVRDAARPIQVVHVDDAASALALAVTEGLTGVFNVAADSWLEASEAAELTGVRRLPGLPAEVAERVLGGLWSSGLGDAPPSLLPYLVHPWVISTDRITAAGFSARQTNEEAIVLASPGQAGPSVGWLAASGAILAGVVGASVWSRRRRRRRRRRL
jgi:UDP-glucose 4-epimerase